MAGHRERYQLRKGHLVSFKHISPQESLERDRIYKYSHYHSLWWGGERIWSGEFIRLLGDGTTQVPAPGPNAGPERVLCLAVRAFYRDSSSKKTMVAGILYELMDYDVSEVGEESAEEGEEAHGVVRDPGTVRHMPAPPAGFAFKLLTPDHHETEFEVEYIAGRYYPLPQRLDSREVIAKCIARGQAEQKSHSGPLSMPLDQDLRSLALAGLLNSSMVFMLVS